MKAKWFHAFLSVTVLLTVILSGMQPAAAASLSSSKPPHRYILVAKSEAEYDQLRNDAVRAGAKVVREMRQARTLVVTAQNDVQAQLTANTHAQSVAKDHVEHLIQPQLAQEMGYNATPSRIRIDKGHGGGPKHVTPDPAFSLPGLMWNVDRINAPKVWKTTTGSSTVLVGVADTGLDYTHSELAPQVAHVENLTDPTLCTDYFGYSDADFAGMFGGPADTDWNGHGSWIGGNIAAALDGVGVNGIAPDVKLVALKISEWCGYAYDSSILNAFYYAADNGIDVVSISFGGYLDRSDPDQNAIYQAYVLDFCTLKSES